MKNDLNLLILLLALLPTISFAQEPQTKELTFEVNRIYSYITVSKEEMEGANNIVDLNEQYKPSWIKEFKSVEVITTQNGKIRKATGKNDHFTPEQKDLMATADSGEDILVIVSYIPDNTLKHNDVHEYDFKLTIDPDNEAKYPGGTSQLNQYLQQNAFGKINKTSFSDGETAVIKFMVSEEGEIIHTQLFSSSNDEKTDEILLEVIRKMPCWIPAEYADGTKVKQQFALVVGDLESCVMPMLNFRKDLKIREPK